MKTNAARSSLKTGNNNNPGNLPTFLDHIHELRRRLFWVLASVILASAAAFPCVPAVMELLTAPLGGQKLYYLTPIGGISFSFKISLYLGIIASVPVVMYHFYKFIEPIFGGVMRRSALLYLFPSFLLAVAGILFSYFLLLPSALRFLSGIYLGNVEAMLTLDSYLSFVVAYLLGGALLFQIPMVLLVIDKLTPLAPARLMAVQRFVIVAAFIVAAIISPTPDIFNQLLFALPIIFMYELGVLIIWIRNRSSSANIAPSAAVVRPVPARSSARPSRRPKNGGKWIDVRIDGSGISIADRIKDWVLRR